MREMLVCDPQGQEEEWQARRCDYHVLIGEMPVSEGFACESYGVKVTDRASGESASVPNITVSASRIQELVELLSRNSVTPCTLEDVVADWL